MSLCCDNTSALHETETDSTIKKTLTTSETLRDLSAFYFKTQLTKRAKGRCNFH